MALSYALTEQQETKTLDSFEVEQKLLSVLLTENYNFDTLDTTLRPDHFSDAVHRQIYFVIAELLRAGKGVSPTILGAYFENKDMLSDIGGKDYISQLAITIPDTHDVMSYANHIIELSVRRGLIDLGKELVQNAMEMNVEISADKLMEEAETKLYGLAQTDRFGKGFVDFQTALWESTERAEKAYQSWTEGGFSGISTGLKNLDFYLGGLQASDLLILAGRPSMGKTALATNIAYNIANSYQVNENVPSYVVGFFSLEMSAEQLATRIISEQANISSEKIRRGQINNAEYERLVQQADKLKKLPIYIDETGGLSVAQLAARARKLKRQKGLDVLIIDYLQLLNASSGTRKNDNRVQEMTQITTTLKSLAKELNIPIIALSQLSRQVEQRDSKRPQLADLRESGSIEQDADIVFFVYREVYYLQREEPTIHTAEHEQWQEKMGEVFNKAEVIVAKQRHGPTGTARLEFNAEFTRFSDEQHNVTEY